MSQKLPAPSGIRSYLHGLAAAELVLVQCGLRVDRELFRSAVAGKVPVLACSDDHSSSIAGFILNLEPSEFGIRMIVIVMCLPLQQVDSSTNGAES